MKKSKLYLLIVLFPLLLFACKGSDPIVEVPGPPTPEKPDNGNEGDNKEDDDTTPKPWDENRGKTVRPSAGNGWTVTPIEDGIIYYAFDGKEAVTKANQRIFITEIDLNNTSYSVKLGYYSSSITASKVFKGTNAIACINAGYEKAALYLKVNGTTQSNISADTIGDTGVPQWKSEAAVYLNQDRDVRIEFTGKGMNLAEWRSVYRQRAAKENTFITSAPMLIDDFEPVGKDFCTLHPKSAYLDKNGKDSNSENPYNHQGSNTNPRTALAKTENNHLLFIVVDGRRPNISTGISAANLTQFLVNNFNPQYAINLDGGGSSAMCVQGQGDPTTHVVNYPCDNMNSAGKDGSPKESNGPDHAGERPRDTFFYVVKK